MEVPKVAVVADPMSENSFAGMCEGPGCGPFITRGWPTAEIAEARILQHEDEHRSTIEFPDDPSKHRVVQPIEQFRADHGLVQDTVDGARAIFPEDAVVVGESAKAAKASKGKAS